MLFIEKFKQYISENATQLYAMLFTTILAYGYFITNWALSIDSEIESFRCPNFENKWLLMTGGYFIYVLDLLHNNSILPFWNDFLSVSFIFLSCMIWLVTINCIHQDKRGQFIFGLIYLISPIYVFYLRFTTYNISISIGLVLSSLAAYYFVQYLTSRAHHAPCKKNLILTIIYLYLAICTYQMFAFYWISSFLLIANYQALTSALMHQKSYKKSICYSVSFGIGLLLSVLILYKTTSIVVAYFIPESPYTASLISWGKSDLSVIINNLWVYYKNLTTHYYFNFFTPVTFLFSFFFAGSLLLAHRKNLFFIACFYLFLLSAFFLSMAMGTAMVLRTMQNLPLVLAGTWLMMHYFIKNRFLKKMLVGLVIGATFFNAQYIVKLFYSDNMRFLHDMNYANQLYQFTLQHVGSSIYVKPWVIIGSHPYPNDSDRIFMPGDTMSTSFFEYDYPNIRRDNFMRWLGNQHVSPNNQEEILAKKHAVHMGNFPDHSSIKETKDLIILKISNSDGFPTQKPIKLPLKNNSNVMPADTIRWDLDMTHILSDQIQASGWAYFIEQSAVNTNIHFKLQSEENQLIFPTNLVTKPGIARWFHDGKNLDWSGFSVYINKQYIPSGDYKIYLVLTNQKNIAEVETHQTIHIT